MTPEEFLQIQARCNAQIDVLRNEIYLAYLKAKNCPPPEQRRRAEPRDITVGNVIWYERSEQYGGWFWNVVEEVRYPDDDFKAYVADDGCRYGLKDAWVIDIERQ